MIKVLFRPLARRAAGAPCLASATSHNAVVELGLGHLECNLWQEIVIGNAARGEARLGVRIGQGKVRWVANQCGTMVFWLMFVFLFVW